MQTTAHLTKLAKAGDADAQSMLATRLAFGGKSTERRDWRRIAKLWRAAAEAGHSSAQFYVGTCYDDGKGVRRNLAQAIEANVEYSETHETILEVDEEAEAPEGRGLFRVHRTRERNPALVKKKKKAALRKSGCLRCEVCGFDFQKVYGDLGQSFIECHHTVPVSELEPGATTRLKDLALVCANCHRMLHRGGETLTVRELRKSLK